MYKEHGIMCVSKGRGTDKSLGITSQPVSLPVSNIDESIFSGGEKKKILVVENTQH